MKYSSIILVAFFVLIIACNKSKTTEPNRTPEENQILKLAYKNNYKYPTGFYQNDSGLYVNTYYLKFASQSQNTWIELSTNDINQAFAWADSTNNYFAGIRILTGESVTGKYFEFRWQDPNDINNVFLSRVHKTSYFIPLLDRLKKTDTIGIFNGQMNKDSVNELIQYLWSCGSLGTGNFSKVAETQITEYNDHFEEYIKSFQLVIADFGGGADSIYVSDNYIDLSKSSRLITLKSNQVDVFVGY